MAQGYTKGLPLDIDGTLAANSDAIVPSQKAVKTYVDAHAGGGGGGGTTTNSVTFTASSVGDAPPATFNGSVPVTVGTTTIGAQPIDAKLSSITALTYASTSFVKMTGANTFTLDTNTYLTSVGTGTTNELTYWSGTNTIGSLSTGTYPSLTELAYLKGVTSSVQTQLNSKQNTITGGATTITTSDLTASRALISNASGKVDVSTVTSTELGYLSGVTSNVQTQLNSVGAPYNAYTMKANNTAASAAPSNFSFKDVGEQAFTATLTWNNTAPTGPTLRYRWFQIGNMVQYFFVFNYSGAGVNNSIITYDVPSDMPTPAAPTGTGAASTYIYRGIGLGQTSPTVPSTAATAGIWSGGMRRDSTNTKYEFYFSIGTPLALRAFTHTGFYFT